MISSAIVRKLDAGEIPGLSLVRCEMQNHILFAFGELTFEIATVAGQNAPGVSVAETGGCRFSRARTLMRPDSRFERPSRRL